eukprot:TRINITY_DN10579_c0_g1_i12.p2 TRINITY_DN10579_c0_g1~~TRINITY_DN10579_c0_g1_i12.p2  ORF type:complete len:144 (-),score=14.75 TRINITY_DN10579_c0_g1_i12:66-497(-)
MAAHRERGEARGGGATCGEHGEVGSVVAAPRERGELSVAGATLRVVHASAVVASCNARSCRRSWARPSRSSSRAASAQRRLDTSRRRAALASRARRCALRSCPCSLRSLCQTDTGGMTRGPWPPHTGACCQAAQDARITAPSQ